MSRSLVTLLAGLTSVTGQWLSNGELSLSQTILDVFFVRFISLQKTTLVFRLAEGYRRTGAAQPLLVEAGLQMFSESVGAYLYPRAQMLTQRLAIAVWPETTSELEPVPVPSGAR